MSLNRWLRIIAACAIGVVSQSRVFGEIIYQNASNKVVRGSWLSRPDQPLELFGSQFSVDLNLDAINDVTLFHDYKYSVLPVTTEVLPYVLSAMTGLHEVRSLLNDARLLALESANTGVNDDDVLNGYQAELEYIVDTIGRLAESEYYNRTPLLNGSVGLNATVRGHDFEVSRVGRHAVPGIYDVFVESPTERASVQAIFTQQGMLAYDEVLTVNNVSINLYSSLTQSQVINRINEFASHTGVLAGTHPETGATILFSEAGGGNSMVCAVSSRSASSSTSGFGNTNNSDYGTNAVLTVDGVLADTDGENAIVRHGAAKGLSLRLDFVGESAYLHSAIGELGTVEITDQSLLFTYPSGAVGRVAFPDVRPQSMGMGVSGNPFGNLSEIRVDSAFSAQNAIGIIDQSYDTVLDELNHLAALQIGVPESRNQVIMPTSVNVMMDAQHSVVLEPGTIVGPASLFSHAEFSVAAETDGYLGIEIAAPDGVHYGWLHLSTDYDKGWIVRDVAFETVPGRAIIAGIVPEPRTIWHGVTALMVSTLVARRRTNTN